MEYKNKTQEAQMDLQKQLQASKKVCCPFPFLTRYGFALSVGGSSDYVFNGEVGNFVLVKN